MRSFLMLSEFGRRRTHTLTLSLVRERASEKSGRVQHLLIRESASDSSGRAQNFLIRHLSQQHTGLLGQGMATEIDFALRLPSAE
jgi:hypothetical protein